MYGKRRVQALTLVVFIAIWQTYSFFSGDFIPPPSSVIQTFVNQVQLETVQEAAFRTTYRVYISSIIALVLGIVIGTADYFSETFSDVINVFFYPTQFVSEAVLALLAIALLGLSPMIIYIVTVIAILPDIFVVVQVGLENIDRQLLEFGKVHSDSNIRTFRHIVIPQVLPYILSGLLRAHATAWDIVATVEIFLVAGGLGFLTQTYYQLLDLPKLFSVVVLILVVGLASDRVIRKIKQKVDERYMDADPGKQPV